jgi:protein SCO1/2
VIGRAPALLIFADYTCRNLCGPMVAFAIAGLQRTKLQPGKDYHFIVIGIDATDSREDARRMKATYLSDNAPLAQASTFLSGDKDSIKAATSAADYHFVYDRTHDQFAHPAAAFAVSPTGAFVRVLSALGVTGDDLRLALIDAGRGRVGSLGDRIRLLCYGFDPAKGIYTLAITRWLTIGGVATFLLLALGIGLMLRHDRSGRTS